MSHQFPRKSRLLREALGNEGLLPTARYTIATIAVVAGSLAVIAMAGVSLPEQATAVTYEMAYRAYVADATLPSDPSVVRDFDSPHIGLHASSRTHVTAAAENSEGWPAPSVTDSAGESANVVDMTY